ncbi:MAG: hypothetical protein WAN20_14655 [Pseudonocardiaceae bacterium]
MGAASHLRPRLSDAFDLAIPQESAAFALPYLREDRPFCLDPFLLWKSDNPEWQQLHEGILRFAECIRELSVDGRLVAASTLLSGIRERPELGLGYASGTRQGSAIGLELARRIVETFRSVPQVAESGINHIEVLALLVPGVAEDRIGDLTAGLIGEWLVEFTKAQCREHHIPMRRALLDSIWDQERALWRPIRTELPWNPLDEQPVLLAPLELLRHLPWINYDNYYKTTYQPLVLPAERRTRRAAKQAVLDYNRQHYRVVESYLRRREQEASLAGPDPLFKPLSGQTMHRKYRELHALPTGRTDGADKKFERLSADLLTSLLYPKLDLAKEQSRTVSGAHIMDLVFHNDSSMPFLADLRDRHASRQLVWELKNVKNLETEHVNQLYRYLDDEEVGRVGVLMGRNPPPQAVLRNTVELHSAKRYFILCFDDRDLELMLSVQSSGRHPAEVLRKKYVEFTRLLPK